MKRILLAIVAIFSIFFIITAGKAYFRIKQNYSVSPPNQEQLQRQTTFHNQMESYNFPQSDIPPNGNKDQVIQSFIDIAFQVAKKQGLTFDGSKSQYGKIIVGKMGKAGPVLIGVEFLHLPKGYATEHIYKSKGTDASECDKITENYMKELLKFLKTF